MDKKKSEHKGMILAIDTDYCLKFFKPGFNALTLDAFIRGLPAMREGVGEDGQPSMIPYHDDLAGRLVLRERHRLETRKTELQVLNYMVLKMDLMGPVQTFLDGSYTQNMEPYYSTYYRKRGGGEDRLADRMSLGWGGHHERDEVMTDDGPVDFKASLLANMRAELNQEVGFQFNGLPNMEFDAEHLLDDLHLTFKGFIYDPSDDVGQHHLALVWEIDVPSTLTIGSKEIELKVGPMCNLSELNDQLRDYPKRYENWSKILIEQFNHVESWKLLGTEGDWISKENAAGAWQKAEAECFPRDLEREEDLVTASWIKHMRARLKEFGANEHAIEEVIRRSEPGGDLAALRSYVANEIQITVDGLFVPVSTPISLHPGESVMTNVGMAAAQAEEPAIDMGVKSTEPLGTVLSPLDELAASLGPNAK